MTLWRRMFTEEVTGTFLYYLPQLFLNSEYRECEDRTSIVKEHYDWHKSSASLSTLKKHVNFFPNTVLGCGGLRGISRYRLTRIGSTSWCLSAIGDGRCHQVCLPWSSTAQNDHITARAIRKHKDSSALLSLSRYFNDTQWSFCAVLLQVEHTYRLSAQRMANDWGESWAHSELREPRGERQRVLKRKPILFK